MKYRVRKNYTTDASQALQDILIDRGVSDIQLFTNPTKACELNPYNLNHIKEGAEMLLRHLRANSEILILVDSDTDGFTSSAVIWLYIKNIFPNAKLNFTVHEHKQHGLSDKIDWIEENNAFDLIIIPDAGSYDVEYHKRLYDLEADCLILDHHTQLYDENGNPVVSNYPNAIVINNQLSPNYANKTLCGAGVVYKFCEVLDDILGIQQAEQYLDLVALGEIADVMDRRDLETNYIIMQGLKSIKNEGLQALLQAQSYSLQDKAQPPYFNLNAIDIAFYIAPLINAITRVGSMSDKEAMFYCFIEPNKLLQSTKRGAAIGDTETAAVQAARVSGNAKSRQNALRDKALDLIDFKIQKEQLDDNNIIVVELNPEDNIPQELTGLAAMGIVSKYHKPCILGRTNSKNEFSGSARSDENFAGLPSLKVFLEQSGYFNYAAGHDNAFGHSINFNKIQDFIDYANKNLNAKDFENCYVVDYVLNANKDNYALLESLASHPEYFGNHINEIKLVITNIPLSNLMFMGKNKDSLKISYNNIDYIKFKDLKCIEDIMSNRMKTLTVYGRANLNTFAGRTSVQIFIDDYDFETPNEKYKF